jgi:hypothetical protein
MWIEAKVFHMGQKLRFVSDSILRLTPPGRADFLVGNVQKGDFISDETGGIGKGIL